VPLGWDALVEKFRGCALAAAAPLAGEKIRRVQAMVRELEDMPNVTALPRALA
jgi:hypothetical protein